MSEHRALTRNEILVLGALRGEDGPRTAYQLLEALRGEGLRAPPQIYRALKALGDRGLVHKIDSRNAFLACNHDHDHAHGADTRAVVFLVCDGCERVEEVSARGLDRPIDATASEHGFVPNSASAEIHGRCRTCLDSEASADV